MTVITAAMVGELRAKTDAPMMECKKALTEAGGDAEKAEDFARQAWWQSLESGFAYYR